MTSACEVFAQPTGDSVRASVVESWNDAVEDDGDAHAGKKTPGAADRYRRGTPSTHQLVGGSLRVSL
jgi:hypothetical protein